MTRFKCVTLDCYGTLVDWRAGIEAELKAAFGDLPLSGGALLSAYVEAEAEEEKSYKAYREVLVGASRRLAERLGFEWNQRAASEFASSPPRWPPFRDTAEALRGLGRSGYRRYVLSNVDTGTLRATLKNWSLEVDGYVTAEETKSYKPAQGHWTTALERAGVLREETLHAAQSLYHDIVPAQRMGISTAWVNRYGDRLPDSVSPTYIVESLSDVESVLRLG